LMPRLKYKPIGAATDRLVILQKNHFECASNRSMSTALLLAVLQTGLTKNAPNRSVNFVLLLAGNFVDRSVSLQVAL
jgi:hypothetical protein